LLFVLRFVKLWEGHKKKTWTIYFCYVIRGIGKQATHEISAQRYEKSMNRQRNMAKNLMMTEKVRNFAANKSQITKS
jgi:hypothetical protein